MLEPSPVASGAEKHRQRTAATAYRRFLYFNLRVDAVTVKIGKKPEIPRTGMFGWTLPAKSESGTSISRSLSRLVEPPS
jgi:hypothetical protein